MANLNRVTLIGRLTRDPEVRSFANGGKVAKFGFAVNNRKKNQQSGQWEDEPVFLNCEAFNRGDSGTLADAPANGVAQERLVLVEIVAQLGGGVEKLLLRALKVRAELGRLLLAGELVPGHD